MFNKITSYLAITTMVSSLLLAVIAGPAYAKHVRVAVGAGVTVIGGTDGSLYTTPNTVKGGPYWAQANVGGAHFNAVIYANNLFVAIADSSTIWTSPDGSKWSSPNSPSGSANFSAIAYGADVDTGSGSTPDKLGRFVIVANEYGTVYYSTDNTAKKWKQGSGLQGTGKYGGTYLYDVIYANKQFIAVGYDSSGSAIYFSPDGETWTRATGKTHPLNGKATFIAVAYAPNQEKNKYVAVANKSTLWYSADGQKWTYAEDNAGGPSGHADFHDIAYNESAKMFVAVADEGTIWESTDGEKWKKDTYDPGTTPTNMYFYSVASSSGSDWQRLPTFVAVGMNNSSAAGSALVPRIWYMFYTPPPATDPNKAQVWGTARCTRLNIPGEDNSLNMDMSAVIFGGQHFIAVPDYIYTDFYNYAFIDDHSYVSESYYTPTFTSYDGQNWHLNEGPMNCAD